MSDASTEKEDVPALIMFEDDGARASLVDAHGTRIRLPVMHRTMKLRWSPGSSTGPVSMPTWSTLISPSTGTIRRSNSDRGCSDWPKN